MTVHLHARNGTLVEISARTATVLGRDGTVQLIDPDGNEASYKLADLVAITIEAKP